jgi:hypothetical protein
LGRTISIGDVLVDGFAYERHGEERVIDKLVFTLGGAIGGYGVGYRANQYLVRDWDGGFAGRREDYDGDVELAWYIRFSWSQLGRLL